MNLFQTAHNWPYVYAWVLLLDKTAIRAEYERNYWNKVLAWAEDDWLRASARLEAARRKAAE